MGWKKHVPGATTLLKHSQDKWLMIVRKIHKWIYSWMKPGYVGIGSNIKFQNFY